jgi:hypothetical protein
LRLGRQAWAESEATQLECKFFKATRASWTDRSDANVQSLRDERIVWIASCTKQRLEQRATLATESLEAESNQLPLEQLFSLRTLRVAMTGVLINVFVRARVIVDS